MMNDDQKALLLLMSIAIGLLILVTYLDYRSSAEKPKQIDPVSDYGAIAPKLESAP